MALEMSNFEKARRANWLFGGVAATAPTTYTVKYYKNLVTLEGVGTECDSAGYSGIDITNNLTNFPSTTTGIKSLAVAHSGDPFEEDSDELVSAGIWDQLGNFIAREDFSSDPLIVETGQFLYVGVGDLTFTVS